MAGAVKHRLLNTRDALAYLGGSMSARKLKRYKLDLKAVRLGSYWYWRADLLDRWVAGELKAQPDDLKQPHRPSQDKRSAAARTSKPKRKLRTAV